MKKYLLGLFAVALAIGFSSFSVSIKKPLNTLNTYYWYPIDDVNNEISGTKLNSSKVDKTTAMSTLTDCRDENATLCIAGSSDPSLGTGDAIPSFQTDNYVNHNN